jgi:hypothetical protein
MSRIGTTVVGMAVLIALFAFTRVAHAGPTNLVVDKCSASKIKSAGKEAVTLCSNLSSADAVRTTADTFISSPVCTRNPGANPDCL